MTTKLTPIQKFGNFWAKRDDLAAYTGDAYPSGSKVRQYAAMAAAQPKVPMIVGCSADSAMQIYVAAAARQARVHGIIYTTKRKVRSAATIYAIRMGAEVIELAPGYLSQCRSRAKARAMEMGEVVRWNSDNAVADATAQCRNIPKGVKRIIVPTGSGLTAAGILAGVSRPATAHIHVIMIPVSGMACELKVYNMASKLTGVREEDLNDLGIFAPTSKYGDHAIAHLPDGDTLDPYYAAKALPYVQAGDLLWVPGIRPKSACPADVQANYQRTPGF